MSAQYSVSVDGGPFHMIRDFSQERMFTWSPELYEHEARVRVTVRNNDTIKTLRRSCPSGLSPASRTGGRWSRLRQHPLVALFSAPPCPEGASFAWSSAQGWEIVLEPHFGRTLPRRAQQQRLCSRHARRYRLSKCGRRVGGTAMTEPGAWITFHTGLLNGRFPPVSTQRRALAALAAPTAIARAQHGTDLGITRLPIWKEMWSGTMTSALPHS